MLIADKKIKKLGGIMNKYLVALMMVVVVSCFVSCSKNSPFEPESSDDGAIYQRPDFIDERPEEIKAEFTLTDCEPVKLDPSATKAKYALVIGISNYSGTANDLNYCDDDASDWEAYLKGKGYTVTKLVDLSATKSNIESAINTLAGRSIAGSEIFFVYSGHGYKGNMITTDMYYLSYSWLKTKFSVAKSTKMGFTFDACQIGAFKTAMSAAGRIVDVASGTNTYSYDGDSTMKNGVFTYYQMEGWSKYNYFEEDSKYACDKMIAWGKAHGVKCTPSYADSYTGSMIP
ncbi:TPA: hypothetical protein DCR49_08590 [Candidatus Delongbacteria bacterium]|nr:hypothetical protein [Candidatus Delongbacteria bacterium]